MNVTRVRLLCLSLAALLLAGSGAWEVGLARQTETTPEAVGEQPGPIPGVDVIRFSCVDDGDAVISVFPLADTQGVMEYDATPLPHGPADVSGYQQVSPVACRHANRLDRISSYQLMNEDTGEVVEIETGLDDSGVKFNDVPDGSYTLAEKSVSGTITSRPFVYEASDEPYLVIVIRAPIAEHDWDAPTEDPEDLAQATIIPYTCEDAGSEADPVWYHATFGVELAASSGDTAARHGWMDTDTTHRRDQRDATATLTFGCERAGEDAYSFDMYPIDGNGERMEPVPLFWSSGGLLSSDWLPMGTYEIVEHTTQTTLGSLYLVAGHDFTFVAPG